MNGNRRATDKKLWNGKERKPGNITRGRNMLKGEN